MANYNQFKQAWDSMNDTQRKQAVEQNKNNAQFQQFAQQYNNEVNWWSVNVQQVVQQANKNWNLNNTTNQWTNTQWSTTTNQNQTNANGTNWQNNTNNSWINNWWTTWTDKSVVSQDFDQSRLTNDNAQVSVKEWTASQTWMPDYELNSDARDNEIVNNLNAYINSNPEFFTDRNTFNQSFHYSERNSRQKALLDSFWKWQEDKKTASNYNTGDAIATGMKNSDITPDIMNLIRQNNPEAYAEWQKQMQEEINKRIANFTTPADPYSTADLFKSLVEKLNIEPEDPLQIYDNWYWMCERLGVFKDSEKLANQQAQIEANHKQIENITKQYSANAGWATSSALSAARLNKALQPYLAIESSLQNEYSLLLQWRNSNLAIANQSANAMVMQANENQRIFNQKLSWLGFAVTTANFRTPEQTLQNQLNYQSALNDLNLLNQSRINDLSLYNQAATLRMQNQLNSELSNLDVDDPVQQRANLNNVVWQYFAQYWNMIQRSQQQVVDDVLKYARDHWVSVAQALTDNFIKPLQSKPEYQALLRKSTWYDPNESQQKWKYWVDKDWNITYSIEWYWTLPSNLSRSDRQNIYQDIYNQSSNNVSWMASALATSIQDWSYTWQCWEFVNDYLIWIWWKKIFWDSLASKTQYATESEPMVWSIVIMDSATKWENWHVWVVTWVNKEKWTIEVTDSNWNWDKLKLTHEMSMDAQWIYWYYYPEQLRQTVSTWYTYDEAFKDIYADALWGKLNSNQKLQSALEVTWARNWTELANQAKAYKQYVESQITNNEKMLLKTLYDMQNVSWRNYTAMQYWTYLPWSNTADFKASLDSFTSLQSLQNLIKLKSEWATFWALSDNELNFITNSSTLLNKDQSYDRFMEIINNTIKDIEDWILKRGWEITWLWKADSWWEDIQQYYWTIWAWSVAPTTYSSWALYIANWK